MRLLYLTTLFISIAAYAKHFSGNKIGKVNNGTYTIVVDTLLLKHDLASIVSDKPIPCALIK